MICETNSGRPWALAVLALVLLVVSAPHHALAQTARDKARTLLIQGNERYEKGDMKGALDKFRAAYAVFASFKIHYNIATTLNDLGRPAEAAEHLALYFAQGGKNAQGGLASGARALLDRLEKQLASVRVNSTVKGYEVELGGKLVGFTPLPGKIYLRPGQYRLVVSKRGYIPLSTKLALSAGDHRSLSVALKPVPVVAVKPPPKPGPKPKPEPVVTGRERDLTAAGAGPRPDHGRRRTKTIWAYATLGVGLALAVGAGALYGVGASQGDAAYDDYQAATNPLGSAVVDRDTACQCHDEVESARTKIIAANVLAGAAVVALGISVYQFVTRPPEGGSPDSGARASVLGVTPAAQGALITLGGSF